MTETIDKEEVTQQSSPVTKDKQVAQEKPINQVKSGQSRMNQPVHKMLNNAINNKSVSEVAHDPLVDFKTPAPNAATKHAGIISPGGQSVINPEIRSDKISDASEQQEADEYINKASLGPGIILKNMRSEAKLSKEDVAKELRLAVRHIEYLENDNFEKFTALAFYIGYLRNYSKLLELDSEKMVTRFYTVYKVMPDNGTFKRIKVTSWQEVWPLSLVLGKENKPGEIIKNIKLVVFGGIIAISFFVLWWLLSTSGAKTPSPNQVVNIEELTPEKVDNLLPSQPVIAANKVANNKTNKSNNSGTIS